MRYWIRDPLRGFTNNCALGVLRLLPTEWCSSIGALLGALVGGATGALWVPSSQTLDNWRKLKSGCEVADARAAMRQARENLGRTIAEYAALERLMSEGRLTVDGAENIQQLQATNTPIIVLGLHLSNWEVIGPTLIGLGQPFSAVYHVPKNRFLHRTVVGIRKRYGAELLPTRHEGAREAIRVLSERKNALLIYVDEIVDNQVQAPALGRLLSKRSNLAIAVRLAATMQAKIVVAYAVRLRRARFKVSFLPPISIAAAGVSVEENMQMLDRVIEPIVLDHLEEWYMLPMLQL
jgi:KDO2-lipid IV(A) lauroyltransferase